MPVTTDAPATTRHDSVSPRQRFTRADCDALRDSGVLTGHYELINGEIINKMGQNPPHATAVMELLDWLMTIFGSRYVRCQLPINVRDADNPTSEPEPDCVVISKPRTTFSKRHPGPADIVLICEISDTTLALDLVTKAALYGRAGIPEYWVLDISGRQLIVHREPVGNAYTDVAIHGADEQIATLALPEARVLVGDLFAAE